ncbi:MAG: hypothetical protein MUC95_03510 [Spirochaetes bacterium]|nr:hypothetical protein [Spirochaetota bacterium]
MDLFLLLTFLLILGIVLWALLGKGADKSRRKETGAETEDKLFRRRASDKVIEDEFPDDRRNLLKRKTDVQPEARAGEPGDDFNLPYLSDDIISERSRFKVYKRTVVNSEIYAKKGDYGTAISLYQGVNKRINDKNVNAKITANIDYLKNYQKTVTEKRKEAAAKERSGSKQNEIKFTIDGPFKIPEKIQIELAGPGRGTGEHGIDLEKMADNIVGKLVDKKLLPSDSKKLLEGYQAEIERLKNKLGKPKAAGDLSGAEAESGALQQITGKILDKVDGLHSDIKNLKNEMASHYSAGTSDKITDRALSQTEGFTSRIQDLKNEMSRLSNSGLIGKPTGKAFNQLDDLHSKVQDLKSDMALFARSGVPAKKIVEKTLPEIEGLEVDIKNLRNEIGSIAESGTHKESIDNKIRFDDELKKIKNEIEELTKGKTGEHDTQQKMDKYRTEVDRLQDNISQLMDFKEKAEKEKSPESKPVDEASMGTIKEVIKNLNDRIEQLSEKEKKTREELQDVKTYNRLYAEGLLKDGTGTGDEEPFEEASIYEPGKKPSLAEAKFKASDKIPTKEAPAAKPVAMPGKKEAVAEKEKPDFELLSEYGREEEEEFTDASDSLSDDDIFEKILSVDEKKKEEDSFEILGYKKEEKEREFGYDIEDAEVERKRMEEEKFYRKFLKYDKRKKKELPILKVSYDFTKLPDDFSLSRDKNILEYSFYKYKGLLEKANELIKTRNVKDAINYYKVVLSQNIPFEFKAMLRKNINELTEYIEKYLSAD